MAANGTWTHSRRLVEVTSANGRGGNSPRVVAFGLAIGRATSEESDLSVIVTPLAGRRVGAVAKVPKLLNLACSSSRAYIAGGV